MKKLRFFWKKLTENKRLTKNILMFSAGVVVVLSGVIILWVSSLEIPDFHSFDRRKIVNSTQIYDRTGRVLLYDIHQDVKRTNILFSQMSPYIKNATIAIEDSEFYNHGGIRITSIIRAALSNIFHFGIGGGGSTITQQLVKNTLLTSSSGYGKYIRKVKEWILAIKVDNSLPKDKILEDYLNEVPYGGNIYGVEEASRTYFDKDASNLTLAEAAYLAALPQSPTTLSPYGKNRARLDDRKNLVLSRELALRFITRAQYDRAKSEVVTFVPQAAQGIKAPHFVFFIKDYLEQKYSPEMVQSGGLKVTTTLDADLQAQAEQFVKEGALENDKNWNGSNAGLVAIDPKTGQILAMAGSRDYFDPAIEGNFNTATASRQPGSSFKPFIYATAFAKGFTPDTVLFDLPTEFQTTCSASGKALSGQNQKDCYMPQDFDGKFRGPMSLRNALAQSINIPAVKLFYLAGQNDSLQTAKDMGITTLGPAGRYGLTLVIGGGEVTLLDMTSAYGVFADDGIRNPYTGILKVEDTSGSVLEQYRPEPQEVLQKNVALTISDVLSDEAARIPTFGAHSALYVPGKEVAVKTGTTNDNRDAWTIGYTPSIAVGVWAGNNNNTPMKKGGAALAGPIWNKFMSAALARLPDETFEKPDPSIDLTNGKPVLKGDWQGAAASGYPNIHTILYWVDKSDITGPPPANPANDPQYNHWEVPVQNWWAKNGGGYPIAGGGGLTPSPGADTSISILEPQNGATYPASQRINLRVASTGQSPISRIDIFINGVYIETDDAPFAFSFVPQDFGNIQGTTQIKVVGYDALLHKSEAYTTFAVQ